MINCYALLWGGVLTVMCMGLWPEFMSFSCSVFGSSSVRSMPKSSISSGETSPDLKVRTRVMTDYSGYGSKSCIMTDHHPPHQPPLFPKSSTWPPKFTQPLPEVHVTSSSVNLHKTSTHSIWLFSTHPPNLLHSTYLPHPLPSPPSPPPLLPIFTHCTQLSHTPPLPPFLPPSLPPSPPSLPSLPSPPLPSPPPSLSLLPSHLTSLPPRLVALVFDWISPCWFESEFVT